MEIKAFYFTYGSEGSGHPHIGGWTKVIAPDIHCAALLWQMAYPKFVDRTKCLMCANIYTTEEFYKTRMPKDGNNGAFTWDVIEVKHRVFLNIGGNADGS